MKKRALPMLMMCLTERIAYVRLGVFAAVLLFGFQAKSQVLISPTGDGGFENGTTFAANGWVTSNYTGSLGWFVGPLGASAGSRGAYISSDGGVSGYSAAGIFHPYSHLYKDVTIPVGATNINLQFKWKGNGDGIIVMRVYVENQTVTPVGGTNTPGTVLGTYYGSPSTFATVNLPLNTTYIGNKRVIFTFYSDGYSPAGNIAMMVDEVNMTYTPGTNCSSIPNAGTATANPLTLTCSGQSALNLTSGTVDGGITYTWQSSANGTTGWTNVPGGVNLTTPAFTPATPISATTYYRVITTCNPTTQSNTSSTVQVTVNNNIASGTIASSGGNTFCGTASPTLTLSGHTATGTSRQWQSSPNGTTWTNVGTVNSNTYAVPGITSSMLYRVQVTCTASSTTVTAGPILINVAPNPVVGVTSPVTAICNGSSTTMTANGATTYTWAPGTGLSSTTGTTVTATPTATTTYTVTGTLGSCTGTATKQVSVGTPFTVTPVTATPTSVCAGGSSVLSATVPAASTAFCTTSYITGTTDGDYMNNVTILSTTLNNTSGPSSAPFYTLFPTSGSTTATLNAGSTYTLNATVGSWGNQNITAYIDWNWNGTFEASEKLGEVNVGTGAGTAGFSFTVPANAYNGVHRLRVRDVYSVVGAEPCGGGPLFSEYYYGEVEDYNITINGPGSFSAITWTESTGGGTTLNGGTTTVPVTASNITSTKTYNVSVNKDGCTATGNVTVVANPAPTASMTLTTPTVCAGDQPIITFTGTPNAQVVYNINGANPQTVTLNGSGSYTETAPVVNSNSTYALVSATNTTTTCSAALTATASVAVNPRPAGLFIGSTSVCRDQAATISYGTGSTTFPIDVTFSDGVNTYTATATGSSENFPVPTDVPGVFSYEITALSDVNGCNGVAGTDFTGTAVVDVKALPTAVVTSTDAGVCAGGNTDVTITFTGDAPYIFSYYDGTGTVNPPVQSTNTFMFNVSPSVASTYYVQTLLDGNNCAAESAGVASTASVAIWDNTAITTQPMPVSACSENSATITMTATGEGLSYVWYENGVAVSGPNYTPVDNTLTINNITGLSGNDYHVVVSGTCGTDQTSDPATLTEDFGNHWEGATSTAWSDATNWSCGTIPIITTNVMVPTIAPNMPLVDISTALCNDLTLTGAGATLGFTGIGSQLAIHGDLTNSGGTFNGTDGTIEMAGTTQSITGALTFDNLDVNGGGTKTLNGDVIVEGILNLMDGNIELGNSNLTLTQPTLQMGGSDTSFVVTNGMGSVIGQGMGAVGGNPDAVMFHVGIDGTSYTPMMLENLGDVDTFSVRVMENVYVDGDGTAPEEVTNPVVDRTWMVSEMTDGGSIVNMTPYWNAIDETNGFDQAHVYVAHYMGGEWTSTTDSAIDAPAAIASGAMWTTTEDSIMSFSPFAVASYGQFPLAIRLTSITAANAGPRNKVEWRSATEDAGDKYELERSTDAKSFTKIATVAANGKPSTYTQWDESPVEGVNYYRVKLLGTDGKYSYSKVVSATVNKTGDFTIEAYPNPVHNTVSVKVNGVVTGKGSVVVTDVTGKIVSQVTVVEHNGAELNVSHLANGIYLLNYSDDVRNESIKINKQ